MKISPVCLQRIYELERCSTGAVCKSHSSGKQWSGGVAKIVTFCTLVWLGCFSKKKTKGKKMKKIGSNSQGFDLIEKRKKKEINKEALACQDTELNDKSNVFFLSTETAFNETRS